ncbi:MAG TPA: type VI secretion system protein TssA, partial [Gemmatimonadaceae bacterium]|nr:type VI secretion system protein TssA [Gemmatimonadaceae bacterium]
LATERKVADWPQVVKLSTQLVSTETKDLQLTAWLAEALLKRDGLAGLITGLEGLRGILDRYWDGCFPAWDEDDPELRAGPLDWVGTKLEVPVRQTAVAPGGVSLLDFQASRGIPSEGDAEGNREKRAAREEALAEGKRSPEDVDAAIAGAPKAFYKALIADTDTALAAATALEKASDERFGRDAPSFAKLRSALGDIRRIASPILAQKLIDDPDPIVEEAVGEDGAPGAVADGPLAPEPVSVADAAQRVAVAARFLRKQDPTNPAPYLMLRGLRWGELRVRAPEIEPKLLEAPATAVRSRLKGLMLDGKWSDLLEQCETVMATPQGRGWIDLQRYVLTACERLGGSFDGVAAGVRSELRTLLAALPQLREMTLMDDAPTANGETQDWLDAQGLGARDANGGRPADGNGVSASDSEIVDQTAALGEALAEEDATSEHGGLRSGPRRRASTGHAAARDPFATARGELAQGRPNRAIELLLAELARERSPRGRFVRQTQIAYVMVEAGLDAVARPILEKLVSTIDDRSLEDWESGPLVAQPMALLCRVLDRLADGSGDRDGLYLRICRLDPLQAIALQRPNA